jgi:hypothetical protein
MKLKGKQQRSSAHTQLKRHYPGATVGAAVAVGSLVALLLAAASPAQAGTVLTTGIGFKGGDQALIFCTGTNVGNNPVATMTVSLIDVNGNVANTLTCAPVNPGGVCDVATTVSAHCKVEFTGSKQTVRGSLFVVDASNNLQIVEPAR